MHTNGGIVLAEMATLNVGNYIKELHVLGYNWRS